MSSSVMWGDIFLYLPPPEFVRDYAFQERPVLVVSPDELMDESYFMCVPFYSQRLESRRAQGNCVAFVKGECGLSKDCVAKCDELQRYQVTELDFRRGKIGSLSPDKFAPIANAILHKSLPKP
ncbi:MAG: type II toxin-antitoxin system PemK/MazF family toxin [Planctomycetota bacterium]|nr:type II toxin-antitoxin system PemK/MazF family toxin [Planctomycetota bacterium]